MQILLLRSSPPPLATSAPPPITFCQNNVSIRWCVRLCVCMYIQMCVHECMYIKRDWPFPPILSPCLSPLLRLYTNAGKRRRSMYMCKSSSSSRLRNCDSLLSPTLTHLTLPKCCLLLQMSRCPTTRCVKDSVGVRARIGFVLMLCLAHTNICTCPHAHLHTHTLAYTYKHTRTSTHTHTHSRTHAYTHSHIHTHAHTHTHTLTLSRKRTHQSTHNHTLTHLEYGNDFEKRCEISCN